VGPANPSVPSDRCFYDSTSPYDPLYGLSSPSTYPRTTIYGQPTTESYDPIDENRFLSPRDEPLSTFAIDVDTASYSNVRRFIDQGQMPYADAVRIEELVNYFTYDYVAPEDGKPFSVHVDAATCPWQPAHRLVRIGLKGKEIPQPQRRPCNLVFLLDVSGSMDEPNKLPLLKSALRMMVNNLSERDRVAIVVYAGASGLVLPSTSCETKSTILAALDELQAGGSTNGGEGIRLAYTVAMDHFVPEHVNRAVLCTDGDFNVGVTSREELLRMVAQGARQGVALTALGFGMGNYKDGTLEALADRGNGNYAYVDSFHEARKVLVEQLGGTLETIAKDVKIQVEFNPARVGAYRLIGYEDRMLAAEEFNDDAKDAGEIGAGHTVTALYEVVPAGVAMPPGRVDALRYQQPASPVAAPATPHADELLAVKIRYKEPRADTSQLLTFPVRDPGDSPSTISGDFRFAAAVACYGMLLRDSKYRGQATYEMALELAQSGRGDDPGGYRSEFVNLLKTTKALAGTGPPNVPTVASPLPAGHRYR